MLTEVHMERKSFSENPWAYMGFPVFVLIQTMDFRHVTPKTQHNWIRCIQKPCRRSSLRPQLPQLSPRLYQLHQREKALVESRQWWVKIYFDCPWSPSQPMDGGALYL